MVTDWPEIVPNAWPGPIFTHDQIITMRFRLMEDFSAADTQDLPLLDLWELYREATR